MAWAIFDLPFRYDFRPQKAVCKDIEPGPSPQCFPRAVIDAAVAAGKARRVQTPKRDSASRKPNTLQGRKSR